MNPKQFQVQCAGQLIFFELELINAETLARDSCGVRM